MSPQKEIESDNEYIDRTSKEEFGYKFLIIGKNMLPNIFYIICFSISIFASIISISIGLIIILIVIFHRHCRTINNMMMCNIATATILFCILQIVSAGYGLQNDWLINQPACIFRAYLYIAVCTVVCTSYTIQSISRLFFTVLCKHRYLLTWRSHWYLIVIHYLLTIVLPILPVFIGNGLGFENESRLCLCSTKVFSSSIFVATNAYIIPLSIAIIVYGRILYTVRESTRRITAFTAANNNPLSTTNQLPRINIRREMKLMKNILVVVSILLCAGAPYLTVLLWNVASLGQPPAPLYLLIMLLITVACVFKMIIIFNMNNDIKNVAKEYWGRLTLF